MDWIHTSLFELYKIGPGPSSSHTIGPMRAGYDFLQKIKALSPEKRKNISHIDVHLFGSLSATGKGHGTDRAVLAGLLGMQPDTCDAHEVLNLLKDPLETYAIDLGDQKIVFKSENMIFDAIQHAFPFRNTMILRLFSENELLLEREYYSVGGGFIEIKGESDEDEKRDFRYPYSNFEQLKEIVKKEKLSIPEIILENEMSLTKLSKEEIEKKLDHVIDVMLKSVEAGLQAEGKLPGPIGLSRKAKRLFETAEKESATNPDRYLVFLDAFALAASEENSACHLVVTAPTSGAAGVMPALLYYYKRFKKATLEDLRKGMMVAAAIGFVVKHNASISGAEVGCQGEVGTASSMGAGMVSFLEGRDVRTIEASAEIAMEHQLGLTCDPVAGYVQIPCIERNAVGAVTAYNAHLLSSSGDPNKQMVSFDAVVKVMLETGQAMCMKYKETSLAGLAQCEVFC
ncbi:MAG TPA: L-serine ammonia-lyase [Chlamydiales bacterium]|nr:L-serine ammonia-lyase [Chlamydiales bacterium]